MKKIIYSFLFVASFLYPQENALALEQKKLLILPAENYEDPNSISSKTTNIIASEAIKLGRFDVIDRSLLDAILAEQKLQLSGLMNEDDIIEVGNLSSAEEALFIKINTFGQKGVPPKEKNDKKKEKEDEDDSLLEWIVKEAITATIDKKLDGVERYPNNIQTVIQAEVRLINIETGSAIRSFQLYGHHTGGIKAVSLNKALKTLRWQARKKLKQLYILSSEIIELDGRKISIFSGENLGLKQNSIFEISSNDRQKTIKGRTITLPGKPRGLLRITDVGPDASFGVIVRKWRSVQEGNKVYELIDPPTVVDIEIGQNTANGIKIESRLWVNPFNKYTWNISGGLGTVEDSREDMDLFLGLGIGGQVQLFQLGPISPRFGINFPIRFTFTEDDDAHTVSSFIFSPEIGGEISILIGKTKDLFITTHYTFTSLQGKWTYTENSDDEDGELKTLDAVWDKPEPKVNLTGLHFSIGLRFISF
ncbi:MAG: hypothetical protein HN657_03415 [Candidatus Marinimicrobia bacterium]|nr:hypothetical protein [Candidatus Neomarinimicrobiota bacterium]MBT3496510.1 hypothetical protein [Candidatus Neomarinimicrobiota bacterium]MBT3691917.1 hypothetical protein [Candidatus Neomarinimicrobiota bacterium]MBT3732052.1 hypothetical protein [Candidatus Neomarinimicrobiota bacterium]MBT4144224.1 hypothetical protein [Candidatus Neomarinimicrobiota bacterium]